MGDSVNAWQRDADGLFIAMEEGEEKDYMLDCSDMLGEGAVLNSAEVTVPAGGAVELVGDEEIEGLLAKFWLRAVEPGIHQCSCLVVSGQLKEVVRFRVVVS